MEKLRASEIFCVEKLRASNAETLREKPCAASREASTVTSKHLISIFYVKFCLKRRKKKENKASNRNRRDNSASNRKMTCHQSGAKTFEKALNSLALIYI